MPDKMTQYVNNFLYSLSRPHIAKALKSSVDFEKLQHADAGTKLMSLGALLTSGNPDDCIQLADQLDFNDITLDDRSLIALIIFSKFYEHGLVDHHLANPLKHVLAAICPEALQTHMQIKEFLPHKPLIKLDYLPTISTSVTGAIFFSEFIFAPGSRKCEGGHRIHKALTSQGWDVSLFTIGEIFHYSSPAQIDFVIIDVLAFYQMPTVDICDTLSRLRRFFRKIIMVDTDVWAGRSDEMLRSISSHIDYIWGFTVDWPLTREPDFTERSIVFPYFGGFDHLDTIIEAALDWNICTYNFTGSVQAYNLNRIGWLLDLMHRRLPVDIKITSPDIDDGLDPGCSQHMYAQTIAATHAAINLTTRMDGSRPATGRSFEVISLNRLLIQENCPVFHRYFTEGEHFLEFADVSGLAEIIESIQLSPEKAKAICTAGHRFYGEKYSCKKLVEHFQTFL
jgi:hypothetical protein